MTSAAEHKFRVPQLVPDDDLRAGTPAPVARCLTTCADWEARTTENMMMKATKLTLAAALLAGSCSFALAQTATAPVTQGSETGTSKDSAGPGEVRKNAVKSETPAPGMTQHPTGLKTNPSAQGTETGTSPDPAGPGAERNAPGSGNPK